MKDESNFDDKVKDIITDWFTQSGFRDRKLTDTPRDRLQVTPKKYVDTQDSSIVTTLTTQDSSIVTAFTAQTSSIVTALNTQTSSIVSVVNTIPVVNNAMTVNEVANTSSVFGTYYTQSMIIDSDLGWTVGGVITTTGNWIDSDDNSATKFEILLGGDPNAIDQPLQWNDGIDFKMSYLFGNVPISDGTSPFAGTDTWFYHGFGDTAAQAANIWADITLTDKSRAGFAHYNGRVYAITTLVGTGTTATNIQADAAQTKSYYMISFTPTAVTFYINGVLKATHTTNIPAAASNVYAIFCGADSQGSDASFAMSHSISFSETLS